MGNTLVQWRSAIGTFNNFIKCRESLALSNILHLVYYLGPLTLLLLRNIKFEYFVLMLLLMQCGDVSPNPGPLKFCHLKEIWCGRDPVVI